MRLFIHVGHSKTGSSFIQSSFATHAELLQAQGVFYPLSPGEAGGSGITSGNGSLVSGNLPLPPKGTKSYVLSSEKFFQSILGGTDTRDKIKAAVEHVGAGGLTFILFTRDPIDHAESAYQQQIKRGGDTIGVDSFFESYNMPRLVPRFFEAVSEFDKANVIAFNYSKHSTEALDCVLKAVGAELPHRLFDRSSRVNRSMTFAELELQRSLNRFLGRRGSFLSDSLCNGLPTVKSDKVLPSEAVQRQMLERLAPALNEVDSLLPVSEAYGRGIRTPLARETSIAFSREQLETIAQTLGEKLAQMQEELYLTKARSYLREHVIESDPKEKARLLLLAKRQIDAIDSMPQLGSAARDKITAIRKRVYHER